MFTPKSGQVLLDGQPVRYDRKGLAALRRRVGIVFQDPDDQLFSADVYRDVSFGGVNLGLEPEEVRRRVEEALARTGTSELRDRPTPALSYGQKKRVAIAGVLVMEPEVLILDEPTAGLDPQGVSEIMRGLLTQLRDSLGMTVLIAHTRHGHRPPSTATTPTCWEAAECCWRARRTSCLPTRRPSGPIICACPASPT